MKYVFMVLMMIASGNVFAGECVNNNCSLRSRTVNVAKEIVSVPVQVTRRTVQATRNVGRRTVSRVRDIVR